MADGDVDVRPAQIRLQKKVDLLSGVAIIVGGIIGSGIFVSPKGVLLEAGSVGSSLIIWAVTGAICAVGAICYAELGTSITTSGADYGYIRKSFGDLPSFLFLWVSLVVTMPTSSAIISLTFANYILQPLFPGCGPPEIAVALVAGLCLTILTFINCWNVTWATRVQNIFTGAKILALVIIIITGMIKLLQGSTENFEAPFDGSSRDPGRVALAFYSGLFSYSGWNYLNFVTEELQDPYKNLPRAIMISLPLVTVVYILANMAYFVILSPGDMLASTAVAVTFADQTLGPMSWIMPVFVACSTFGALNSAIFASSRLFFVGARNGHLPGVLATINMKHLTPLPALMFGCTTSLVMLSTPDVHTLINYTSFVDTVFITLSVCGLLILRVTQPNLRRPIKVNICFPIFYLIVSVFLIITPLTSSPKECFVGLLVTVAGIPVYLVGVMWREKPRGFLAACGKFIAFAQKLFSAAPEEEKND